MLLRLCRAMWDSDGGVLLFGLPNAVAHSCLGSMDSSTWLLYAHNAPFPSGILSRTALIPYMDVSCPRGPEMSTVTQKSCKQYVKPL